ncbi:hypothetical protein COV06_01060 [Candidatus Uhrbacteria bacterium CG10_big_fil_rev_8_21_14_0_10_50_16]|uniref:MBL fold hydrolase n=1 Tax=Candidatus Uhrbacteria bacterium CG10_big_fil_rev_8_21_14_0_10_50_16 TaxID=1975039 RepID=A0A2H0RN88_9BACT|nr:MAG: hypothetical protein COV06_01060 [Candidatus Uhrbacteria bacterium CG10_big_fil_rev_8_21_14_0_10_50_16]
MQIGFFGATRQVPGSCYLIKTGDKQILIDCGYYQGGGICDMRNYDEFGFDPKQVDVLLVTHAHLDHVGRIPRLFNQGGKPQIYSTGPTKELGQINLEDAHHIMLIHAEECHLDELYGEKDLEAAYKRWQTVTYRSSFEIVEGVTATFYDTGHILGSSFVVLELEGKRIAFSGDVGSTITPLLHDTEALPTNLDVLVCESTYGDRLHPEREERKEQLRAEILRNHKQNGVLMIPAFSIERTQEILFEMNELIEHDGLNPGQVFLDSPLAITAIAVFQKYSQDTEMMQFDVPDGFTDNNFFAFKELHVTDTVDASKQINQVPNPKVIIAGSGMMNAGRIQHHLVRYLDDANNTLLVTGYQAPGTLGNDIAEGKSPVHIFDYTVPVRARVIKIESYSGHADYNKLGNWVSAAQPKNVQLVHGDVKAQKAFKAYLATKGVENVEMPEFGTWLTV